MAKLHQQKITSKQNPITSLAKVPSPDNASKK